jgi:hypothetical protein
MSMHGKQAEQGTFEKSAPKTDMGPEFHGELNKTQDAKHNPELIRRARKFNVRSEQGNADKLGGWKQ